MAKRSGRLSDKILDAALAAQQRRESELGNRVVLGTDSKVKG